MDPDLLDGLPWFYVGVGVIATILVLTMIWLIFNFSPITVSFGWR